VGGRGSGRPVSDWYLHDPRVQAVVLALAEGNTRTHACAYARISRDTFYRWHARWPKFAQEVEKAEADAMTRAMAQIQKAAQLGTWQAAAWFLERRDPADYGPRARIDVHVELEAEVRAIALAAGVDYESALAEAERILAASRPK
jgi:Homeodomain-like domain